jgi:hypothetical protein
MILTTTIFGLAITEFIAITGLLLTFIGGLVYIRTKLIEIELKVLEMEERLSINEKMVEATALDLKLETDKINDKLEQKMDKIDSKIDHLLETVNEIKVNCAKVTAFCKFDETKK